eukprot:1383430-Amorphochlora_amoeboformis.AAC.1
MCYISGRYMTRTSPVGRWGCPLSAPRNPDICWAGALTRVSGNTNVNNPATHLDVYVHVSDTITYMYIPHVV